MIRVFLVLCIVALAACSDGAFASGPDPAATQGTACWAYIDLIGRDGVVYRLTDRFDPCPTDAQLEANGWHRTINPMWGPP